MNKREWYQIKVQVDDPAVAEIYIIDFIGDWIDHSWGFGVTARQFIDEVLALPESVKTLRLHVNSPGGDFFAAAQIADILRDQQLSKRRTVEVLIEGIAASAATLITSAGTLGRVQIADNSLIFIHNPWTIALGEAKDFRKVADDLDATRNRIVATYRWRSALSEESLAEMMDAGTLMEPAAAVANGFADTIIQGLPAVVAAFDPRGIAALKDLPEKFRARLAAAVPKAQDEDWRVGGAEDLTLDEDRAWDEDEADERVRRWASQDGSGEKEQMDWPKYRKAFVVYDANNEENFDGYKLGFADVVDGELMAIKAGLQAVRSVLEGGRGGVDLPEAVIQEAKDFVDGYLGEEEEESTDEPADVAAVVAAVQEAKLDAGLVAVAVAQKWTRTKLDEAIAAGVKERDRIQAREKEIRALCATAKLPDLADGLLRGQMSIADVKAHLTTVTAKLDRAEIDTLLPPGDQNPGAASRLTPVKIYEERRQYAERIRLGHHKEG